MADAADALRCPVCRAAIIEWWRVGERVSVIGGRPRKSLFSVASDRDWTCAFCDYSVIRPSKIADELDSIPVNP